MGCCATNQRKHDKNDQKEFKEHDCGAGYQPEKPEKVTKQNIGSASHSGSGSADLENKLVKKDVEQVRLTFGLPKQLPEDSLMYKKKNGKH